MRRKIAVLGSTGSIGKNILSLIDKDRKNFNIILLTANKNYKTLFSQAEKFKVKNLIITDKKAFDKLKDKCKKKNINLFSNFKNLKFIFNNKVDYVMNSIIGLDGLNPTLDIIKHTKKIAIANKESIICGWELIKRELKKNNTEFLPVDSEHFSLWFGLKNQNKINIEKIYLTASGGPLYKTPIENFKNIKINKVLKHPNWKMGKKISIDSATMINKVYEVIEAKNIFNIDYKKIEILIHPKSYVHALLKFQNGIIKILAHDTTMKIPIFNTLYSDKIKKIKSKNLNINLMNNLNFDKVSPKRYPMIKLLDILPKKSSLFETIIVSANDTLVQLYLQKKIKFNDIHKYLFQLAYSKRFKKYKSIYPKKVRDIVNLNNYVRLIIYKNVYKPSND